MTIENLEFNEVVKLAEQMLKIQAYAEKQKKFYAEMSESYKAKYDARFEEDGYKFMDSDEAGRVSGKIEMYNRLINELNQLMNDELDGLTA